MNNNTRIKKLKYVTHAGNKIELDNAPVDLGINMLFLSLDKDDRESMLKELTENHAKQTDAELTR